MVNALVCVLARLRGTSTRTNRFTVTAVQACSTTLAYLTENCFHVKLVERDKIRGSSSNKKSGSNRLATKQVPSEPIAPVASASSGEMGFFFIWLCYYLRCKRSRLSTLMKWLRTRMMTLTFDQAMAAAVVEELQKLARGADLIGR